MVVGVLPKQSFGLRPQQRLANKLTAIIVTPGWKLVYLPTFFFFFSNGNKTFQRIIF